MNTVPMKIYVLAAVKTLRSPQRARLFEHCVLAAVKISTSQQRESLVEQCLYSPPPPPFSQIETFNEMFVSSKIHDIYTKLI